MPFGSFFRDRKGGVTPLIALGIIPLVGSVGAAVDYSRATSYFTANFSRPEVHNVQIAVAASPVSGGASFNLTATGSITTEFLGLMGMPTLSLSVKSGALGVADGLGCVLSLDKTAGGAITATNTVTTAQTIARVTAWVGSVAASVMMRAVGSVAIACPARCMSEPL